MVHLHIMAGMCGNIGQYFLKKVDSSKGAVEWPARSPDPKQVQIHSGKRINNVRYTINERNIECRTTAARQHLATSSGCTQFYKYKVLPGLQTIFVPIFVPAAAAGGITAIEPHITVIPDVTRHYYLSAEVRHYPLP
ncbi:hypothetical protein J6590_077679 [Homalodisca vitripennis]|nr:hypothetical protein J6590_077679 [Homalodisca vitripennis]